MARKDNPPQLQNALEKLLQLPENRNCADCGQRGPRWASTNLGIFLCIKCAGLHRGMNTDISKVKSVSMDKWTREQVDFIASMGNAKSNRFYEHRVTASERAEQMFNMKEWIRNKYVVMKYIHPNPEAITNTPSTSSSSSSSSTTPRLTNKPLLQAVPDLVEWGEPTIVSTPTPFALTRHSHSVSPVPQGPVSPVPYSHAVSPVPQTFEDKFDFSTSVNTLSSVMDTIPTPSSWDHAARPPTVQLDKEAILKLYGTTTQWCGPGTVPTMVYCFPPNQQYYR